MQQRIKKEFFQNERPKGNKEEKNKEINQISSDYIKCKKGLSDTIKKKNSFQTE